VLFISRDFAGANPGGTESPRTQDWSHAEDQTDRVSDFGHKRKNYLAFRLIQVEALIPLYGKGSMEDVNLHAPDKLCHFATDSARGLSLVGFRLGGASGGMLPTKGRRDSGATENGQSMRWQRITLVTPPRYLAFSCSPVSPRLSESGDFLATQSGQPRTRA
jgi:hypothetical protein